jgi:hypothetical protein
LTILEQRGNVPSGQLRILGQLSVLPACQSFTRADPKTPIAAGEQAHNVLAREVFAGWQLELDLPNAIEVKQPESCSEP